MVFLLLDTVLESSFRVGDEVFLFWALLVLLVTGNDPSSVVVFLLLDTVVESSFRVGEQIFLFSALLVVLVTGNKASSVVVLRLLVTVVQSSFLDGEQTFLLLPFLEVLFGQLPHFCLGERDSSDVLLESIVLVVYIIVTN